jgi:hypothetical protein
MPRNTDKMGLVSRTPHDVLGAFLTFLNSAGVLNKPHPMPVYPVSITKYQVKPATQRVKQRSRAPCSSRTEGAAFLLFIKIHRRQQNEAQNPKKAKRRYRPKIPRVLP